MNNQYVDSSTPVILWFRTDLRLNDHSGVISALAMGRPIVPVYIWDSGLGTRPLGAASKWWLHQSLKSLDKDLRALGSRLIILEGTALDCLAAIIKKTNANTIICSHSFDPAFEEMDETLSTAFAERHVDFQRHNATLLAPPGLVRTKEGNHFRVFTPFFKALVESGFCDPGTPDVVSKSDWRAPTEWPQSMPLESLGLDKTRTASGRDWAVGFTRFTPGEAGALTALRQFLSDGLTTYDKERDRPDLCVTSQLSPHLRFGEISPQRILFEVNQAVRRDKSLAAAAAKFRSEMAWREFSYGLLFQQPRLDSVNFRGEFDDFTWRGDDKGFRAWCRGETGYDLVDAGMRELWQTGYMHNRVRMVCASFLIKHLLIDWRRGEQWFWDCLLDADPANNPASWQWVAGCGADAAPYFRIFNPITQAEKFDPAGLYRARYIPGYARPSTGKIHIRSQADLFDDGNKTQTDSHYPQPVVDHAYARQRALDAYTKMRALKPGSLS